MLTYLKTNGKARNSEGEMTEWICILISSLRAALKKKGISSNPSFAEELRAVYKTGFKKSSHQLFLSPNSSLLQLPSGDKWRHSPECYYGRASMIERSCLSKDTLCILDKGNFFIHLIYVTIFL